MIGARWRAAMQISRALVIISAVQTTLTEAGSPSDLNSIGVFMPYLSPDQPLLDAAGLMVRYDRRFCPAPPGSSGPANSPSVRRCLVLSAGLASVTMDRDSEGVTKQGEVSLRYPAVGLGESWRLKQGTWTLLAGGGLDYFFPEAKGKFSVSAPIGISNEYDVDSGFGVFVNFDAELSLGADWGLVFGAGYLFASLNGEQRFVASGISGIPVSADFDLTGPQATLGLAHRF